MGVSSARAESAEGKAPSLQSVSSLRPEQIAAPGGHPHPATGPAAERYRPIDCWYRVKPIPEQTAAMIQKRSMIFVSDQAIISKWW